MNLFVELTVQVQILAKNAKNAKNRNLFKKSRNSGILVNLFLAKRSAKNLPK